MLESCSPLSAFTLTDSPPSMSQNPLQLLQHLWGEVNYGIFVLDVLDGGEEFRYAAFNPAFARTSRIPVEQLLGKTIRDTLPDARAKFYLAHYAECVRSGHPVAFEERFSSSGQDTCWLFTVSPFNNSPHPTQQLSVTTLDISELSKRESQQTQAEESLAHNEAKFRRLVEDANDVIVTWGLDGNITYLSPSFRFVSGYEPADWLGKSFVPLVHPEDLSVCMTANQQVAETGEKRSGVEFRHQHTQGHWVWLSINISPIKDAQGQVVAFQGIMRDISDRKQREDALRFIVEGTIAKTGAEFFQACVQSLSEIFQVQYAFVTELVDQTYRQSRMLALWTGKELVEPYTFDLVGTPCRAVFEKNWGIFPTALQEQFPEASGLATLGAESYCAIIITNSQGQAIGNLGIIDTKPLADNLNTAKSILQMFATRVGAEMERYAVESDLQAYADRQTLLNKLSHQIRNSLDLGTVIATTVESIREILNIDQCTFAWYDLEAVSPTWELIQESKRDGIPSILGTYSAALVGVPEQILLNQELLQIDDVDRCQESAHQKFLQTIACKSEILLPICTRAHQLGIIVCIEHHQARPWAADEIELLRAVGDQLAIAIAQAELYAESRSKSQELQQTLQELQWTQAQMLQSEKMSSLGQLVAGVAHEINNPVNFIHGNISHLEDYTQDLLELIGLYQQNYLLDSRVIAQKINDIDLDFLSEDLPRLLKSMKVGTDRIREIVKSLRLFSRLDESEIKPVDIHDGIDSTLMILQSRIKASGDRPEIQVIKNYGDLPHVECFAGQLNQVFMNLLANAIDALDQSIEPPTIQISTECQGDRIRMCFRDNGMGIPDSVQAQIFDPFFTTKPVGQGTGMGLSISYQIVTDRHGGQLSCHSTPGQGTEFVIQIPVKQG